MAEAMKYGREEFEVTLPPELIAAELEPNHVDLPQRTVAEHIPQQRKDRSSVPLQ